MYYVYVLKSTKDGSWYTGSTNNLRKRLGQHTDGSKGWTKSRRPWNVVYYEACLNKEDAEAREKYLKTGTGKRYLKNRLKRFLSLTG